MPNLRFLKVYKSRDDGNYRMHIPEEIEFPRRLRLLEWEAYPSKSLPPTFHPEYLVELKMQESQLEYLWQGTQVGVILDIYELGIFSFMLYDALSLSATVWFSNIFSRSRISRRWICQSPRI